MMFLLKICYNGEYTFVPNLESNGYGYIDLTNDVCASMGGEWLGQLVYFESIHPKTGRMMPIENDDDVERLLRLYFDNGETQVNLMLQLQSCTSQSSQLTQVFTQDMNQNVIIDERSDGGEEFVWSDHTDDNDNENRLNDNEKIRVESDDNLSNMSSENDEVCNIIGDESGDDTLESRIGRLSDKMQGDYFKTKIDDKGKEIIELEAGQIFDDVKHLRRIVEEYSVQKGFKLIRLKNDKSRFTTKCNNEGCKWRIHASIYVDDKTFKIKSVSADHTCIADWKGLGASSGWIAQQLLPDFKANINVPVDQMELKLHDKFGVHVERKKLYRAKRKATQLVSGDWAESYALVPSYAKVLLETNPRAYVKMKCEGLHLRNPIFDRLFVSFVAQRDGFRNGLRPFIGLDGCFLKGPYGGQLLSAVALDANSGIFPIAVMVCRQESEDTWGYFLESLTNHLAYSNTITFMSDRQKGLKKAVRELCANDRQRYCARHLYANFRKKFPGVRLRKLFWVAAKAYNQQDFEQIMGEIHSVDPNAYKWLMVDCHEDVATWARHGFDEVVKNDHVTNNMSESFNSILGTYRAKPILTLLEWIRTKVMKRFYTRYQKALEWETPLPPKVMDRVNKNFQQGRHLHPSISSNWTFQVPEDNRIYMVNLDDRTCTCREWQVSGIPCRHAMICISKMRYQTTDYVHRYFTVDAYKMTYQGMINPVPDVGGWPSDVSPSWQPPPISRKRGRPKMSRTREVGETKPSTDQRSVHHRCTLCKSLGHNRSTCHLRSSQSSTPQHQNSGNDYPLQQQIGRGGGNGTTFE